MLRKIVLLCSQILIVSYLDLSTATPLNAQPSSSDGIASIDRMALVGQEFKSPIISFFNGDIIVSILTGVVAAVIFALILNQWQKPRLSFSRESVKTEDLDDRHFYHIRVKNKGHTTAYNCKIDIDFVSKQLANPISIRYGKWAENPEPVILMSTPGLVPGSFRIRKIPDMSLLKNTWYMDIPQKSSKSFALLLKYRQESDCYAFNAENYVTGFENNADLRVESRKMAQGDYIARVSIRGDNVKASTKFIIKNNGPDFLDLFVLRQQ